MCVCVRACVRMLFLLVQDQFYEFMYAEAVRTDNKLLFENKPKFVLVHSSSGHKFALNGKKKKCDGTSVDLLHASFVK